MATTHTHIAVEPHQEWIAFPGGELEAPRPKVMCPSCRAEMRRAQLQGTELVRRTLCFECYKTDLARARAMQIAASLNTASEARFQDGLPFQPVNAARLAALKAERAEARKAEAATTVGPYANRRRDAQIRARHAMAKLAEGLRARQLTPAARRTALTDAAEAAEMQLPESWLPFVVSQ